jgi:hypothetical protein
MHQEISKCRLCGQSGSGTFERLISLGNQSFTGIFPKQKYQKVPEAPLELVKCTECHLAQLAHSYDPSQLYGQSYGYRSGLNASMVRHLQQKVSEIEKSYPLAPGDFVLDIGSNDSTLLQAYKTQGLKKIGIDPSGEKFLKYYPKDVELIPDFFSASRVRVKETRAAKVVTSIAMFYDLENPQEFVDQVAEILDGEGVWVFEQSYLPLMLETNGYDTICHEHLEYYALSQILRMLSKAKLKIIDLQFNDVNGGSFSVTAAKAGSQYPEAKEKIDASLLREKQLGLSTRAPFDLLRGKMEAHREALRQVLTLIHRSGKTVFGYGASTKGNVLLQYCGFTEQDLPFIAEVNEDKFGSFTPGTEIPIISEAEARTDNPDFFLVLPWHFREGILRREKAFLEAGGRFIFPLPEVQIVSETGVQTAESFLLEGVRLPLGPTASQIEHGV